MKMKINISMLKTILSQLESELNEAEKIENMLANDKSQEAFAAVLGAYSKAMGIASTLNVESTNIVKDFKAKTSMMLNPGLANINSLMSSLLPKEQVKEVKVSLDTKEKKSSN